jgi:hypothetical protein
LDIPLVHMLDQPPATKQIGRFAFGHQSFGFMRGDILYSTGQQFARTTLRLLRRKVVRL